jgi:hypothetical protein
MQQKITLNVFQGTLELTNVVLTLPNGEEHLTGDFRLLLGQPTANICTSRSTLIKDNPMLQQLLEDTTKICDQLVITVNNVDFEENKNLISYFTCEHDIFKIF